VQVDEHMHTKFIQFDPAPRRGGPNSKEVTVSRQAPDYFL
jgi:serine/threonine-protein phosphatase 2A catalytic subunit